MLDSFTGIAEAKTRRDSEKWWDDFATRLPWLGIAAVLVFGTNLFMNSISGHRVVVKRTCKNSEVGKSSSKLESITWSWKENSQMINDNHCLNVNGSNLNESFQLPWKLSNLDVIFPSSMKTCQLLDLPIIHSNYTYTQVPALPNYGPTNRC